MPVAHGGAQHFKIGTRADRTGRSVDLRSGDVGVALLASCDSDLGLDCFANVLFFAVRDVQATVRSRNVFQTLQPPPCRQRSDAVDGRVLTVHRLRESGDVFVEVDGEDVGEARVVSGDNLVLLTYVGFERLLRFDSLTFSAASALSAFAVEDCPGASGFVEPQPRACAFTRHLSTIVLMSSG